MRLMRLRLNWSAKDGFTLVEILVASTIALLVLVSLLAALVAGRFSASLAKHKSQALNLIQQRVEQLKSQGYTTLYATSQSSKVTTENNVVLDGNVASRGDMLCTRISTVDDLCGYDDAVEITVQISWNEKTMAGNINVSEEASTLVFDADS